ncbi:hypothetical protein WDU94_014339 [Cyamophila willieti]
MMRIQFKLDKSKPEKSKLKPTAKVIKEVKPKSEKKKKFPWQFRKFSEVECLTYQDLVEERQYLLDFNKQIKQLLATAHDDPLYKSLFTPYSSPFAREKLAASHTLKHFFDYGKIRKDIKSIIKKEVEKLAKKYKGKTKKLRKAAQKCLRKDIEKIILEGKPIPTKVYKPCHRHPSDTRRKEFEKRVNESPRNQSQGRRKPTPKKPSTKNDEKIFIDKRQDEIKKKHLVIAKDKYKTQDKIIDDIFNREQKRMVVEAEKKLKHLHDEIERVCSRISTSYKKTNAHNQCRRKLRKKRIALEKDKLDIIAIAEGHARFLDSLQDRNIFYEKRYKMIDKNIGNLKKKMRKQYQDKMKMIRAKVKTSKIIAVLTENIDWHDKEMKYCAEKSKKLKEEIIDLKQKVNEDCNLNVFHSDFDSQMREQSKQKTKKSKINDPIQLPKNSADFIKAFKRDYKKNRGSIPLPVQPAGPAVTKGEDFLIYNLKKTNYAHRQEEERATEQNAHQKAIINDLKGEKTALSIKYMRLSKEVADLEKYRNIWISNEEQLIKVMVSRTRRVENVTIFLLIAWLSAYHTSLVRGGPRDQIPYGVYSAS